MGIEKLRKAQPKWMIESINESRVDNATGERRGVSRRGRNARRAYAAPLAYSRKSDSQK